MKARSFKQAIFALWALASIMPNSSFAGSIDDLVQKAYRLGEDDAKKQLDLFFESAKIEKKRREKAGEPPATVKGMSDAVQGAKFFIYNRAATNGICMESALKGTSAEYRLPASLHFAESDAIGGVVRARSVHKVGYGHNCDWAAA